jgi:hypothetical protein
VLAERANERMELVPHRTKQNFVVRSLFVKVDISNQ